MDTVKPIKRRSPLICGASGENVEGSGAGGDAVKPMEVETTVFMVRIIPPTPTDEVERLARMFWNHSWYYEAEFCVAMPRRIRLNVEDQIGVEEKMELEEQEAAHKKEMSESNSDQAPEIVMKSEKTLKEAEMKTDLVPPNHNE